MLLALLADERTAWLAREMSGEFARVSVEALKKNLVEIAAGSREDGEAPSPPAPAAGGGDAAAPSAGGKTRALDQYTVDLTDKARRGLIDPVLGRDFEIRQVVDILTRRRQNNPILTG